MKQLNHMETESVSGGMGYASALIGSKMSGTKPPETKRNPCAEGVTVNTLIGAATGWNGGLPGMITNAFGGFAMGIYGCYASEGGGGLESYGGGTYAGGTYDGGNRPTSAYC